MLLLQQIEPLVHISFWNEQFDKMLRQKKKEEKLYCARLLFEEWRVHCDSKRE